MSGLLSQVGSKYREELKKNLCIFGKSRGNNSGKRELVQNLHRFNTCVYVGQLVQKMHGLGDFWDWDDENEWDGKGKKVMLKCVCGIY